MAPMQAWVSCSGGGASLLDPNSLSEVPGWSFLLLLTITGGSKVLTFSTCQFLASVGHLTGKTARSTVLIVVVPSLICTASKHLVASKFFSSWEPG